MQIETLIISNLMLKKCLNWPDLTQVYTYPLSLGVSTQTCTILWHYDNQHNDTQHIDIQYNIKKVQNLA